MNVGSVSSSVSTQLLQRTAEVAESKNVPDRDGDSDDKAISSAKAVQQPTVNANGQTVGTTISTTA